MSDGCTAHPAEHLIRDAFHVSNAAILGVLTRIGVGRLFGPMHANVTSEDSALFLDLPANALGCFFIGFYKEFKNDVQGFSPSVALGLSTGYFGSVTTFASWSFQATRLITRGLWVASIFSLCIGLAVALVSFRIGQDIAGFIAKRVSRKPEITTSRSDDLDTLLGPKFSNRHSLLVSLVLLAALISLLVTFVVIDSNPLRRKYFISALFGPVGALIRWQTARLNTSRRTFPLGTFIANICAVTLDVSIGAAGLARRHDLGVVMSAVITGLGGSLSTVSTWVSEILDMQQSGDRWVYVLFSLGVSQVIGIIVYGTTYWVVGKV